MNKIKVIFLDIDGVLNVIPPDYDEYGGIFHKHFEDNLRWIIEETGAKIVISSTWRFSGLKRMQDMWEFRSLAGEIIDDLFLITNIYKGRWENVNTYDNNIPIWII